MSEVDEAAERAFRARQRRRATVTMIVVVLGLAWAFVYATNYFRDSDPQARPCTTVLISGELSPEDISVNVYNATDQAGLARGVGILLTDRGFNVKDIDNDPEGRPIRAVAELRHGPQGLESAKILLKHIPGAVLLNDKRDGDTVDVVIGSRYRKLAPVPPVVTPSRTTIPCRPATADL